jgi:ubiquinone/menaquinone biosynthesis C-methylase UbiE
MKPKNRLERFNKLAGSPKYKAQEILNILSVQPGAIIADVGSGGGFYTQAFAKAAAPGGLVVAVDTDAENLAYVQDNANALGLINVQTFLTSTDQLELPARKFDWIFMRDMYHHILDPLTYFQPIANFIKTKGLVVVIDYKKVKGFSLAFSSLHHHYSSPTAIRNVMLQVGLDVFRSFDFLPDQSFQIFSLKR